MTEREFYQHSLIEINKLEAPSLLLEDFNYLANKAIQQYVNKVYNRYDINQQSTDDLRALKRSVALEVRKEINSPFRCQERTLFGLVRCLTTTFICLTV